MNLADLETVELSTPQPAETAAGWKDRLVERLRCHEEERGRMLDGRPTPITSRRFRLLREMGRGGMGLVCEAEDQRLGRRVALKVLLAGEFATPEGLERFQIEARAAARLTHPNIVKVLEVGEESGQQFLVMELIEGESLHARLAREGRLTPRDAARIALSLARALDYAHTRSILHRDIKPANVLLREDGEPVLTDFGLAKEVEASAGLTSSGHVMGTPAYMSPEQAKGDTDSVGRRSDVYSLGATLYEMLTGRPPFTGQNVPSLLAKVVWDEPVAPAILESGVDRDLDTICLKCLEKDPGRRYHSARELADDLGHYLAHEPIRARPPSRLERARKWARRNRTTARSLGYAGGVALLVLIVMTGLFLHRLAAERDRANAAADDARQARDGLQIERDRATAAATDARQARDRAALDRDRARKVAQEAREALDVLVFEVRDKLEDLPGQQIRDVRRELLRNTLERLIRLQASIGRDRYFTFQTAETSRQIGDLALLTGDVDQASSWYRRALQSSRKMVASSQGANDRLNRDLAASLHRVAKVQALERDWQSAFASRREAITIHRALLETDARHARLELADGISRLGRMHHTRGEREAAARAYREALTHARQAHARAPKDTRIRRLLSSILDALAEVLTTQGHLSAALRAWEEGAELSAALYVESPTSRTARLDLAIARFNMARIRKDMGDLPGARRDLESAESLSRKLLREDSQHPSHQETLARVLLLRGDVDEAQGDLDRAAGAQDEALRFFKRLVEKSPKNAEYRNLLRCSLGRVASVHQTRGDHSKALARAREMLELARSELRTDSGSRAVRRDVGHALQRMATIHQDAGNLPQARTLLEESIQLRRALVSSGPQTAIHELELGDSLVKLADVLERQGEPDRALAAYREALGLQRGVTKRDAKHAGALQGTTSSLRHIGEILAARGERAAAQKALEEAVGIARDLLKRDPTDAKAAGKVATALVTLGDVQRANGSPAGLEAASRSYQEALRIRRKLAKQSPDDVRVQRNVLIALSKTARIQTLAGKPAEALKSYEAILKLQRAIVARSGESPAALADLAVCLLQTADARGVTPGAVKAVEEAADVLRQLLELDASDADSSKNLVQAFSRLGRLRMHLNDGPGAIVAYRKAASLTRQRLTRREVFSERRNLSSFHWHVANLLDLQGDFGGARDSLRALARNHRLVVRQAPRFRKQLVQIEQALAQQERKCDLLAGDAAPASPADHLVCAQARMVTKEYAQAAAHFEHALRDQAIRTDLAQGHLYNAACAAARAGLREQALDWLEQDIAARRELLRKADPTHAARQQRHLEYARFEDPDLASLRGSIEFELVFR